MRGVVTFVWHYIYGSGVAHSGGLSMSWSICDTDMRHQFVISVDDVESKERNYVRLDLLASSGYVLTLNIYWQHTFQC